MSKQSKANSVLALFESKEGEEGGEEARKTVSVPCSLLVGCVEQGTST